MGKSINISKDTCIYYYYNLISIIFYSGFETFFYILNIESLLSHCCIYCHIADVLLFHKLIMGKEILLITQY